MNLPYSIRIAITAGVCLCITLSACGPDKETKYAKLLKKYDDFFAANKLEEARLSIQSAIDVKPQQADGYYKLGEVLLRQQKFPQAAENFRSAINYDPKHRDARYRLGTMMLAAKEYELAEDAATKILEMNPKDVDALILKANITSTSPRKDYATAEQILNDIMREHPRNTNALASLGMLALQRENEKDAEAHFLKALAIDPKNVPLRLVLADLYAKEGRLDESQSQLQSVVDDDPANATVRFGFGEFLLKRGLGGRAEEQYVEALKVDALRLDARDRLYDIYLARRDVDRARALTKELEKLQPSHPGTEYFRARDLELDQKQTLALEKYVSFIKAQTTFAPAFRRAGILQLAHGEEQEGILNLQKAITIDSGDAPARLELANRALANGKFSEAAEHVNQILSRYPRHLGAHVLRADVAMSEGRLDEARKVYRYLISTFPQSPHGYARLAALEEKDQHLDEAIELYRRTLAFDTNVLAVARRFSNLLAQKKGIPAAREELLKFSSESKSAKPEFDYVLASLALADKTDANGASKARELLLKAVEQRPTFSAAYYALGSLDAKQGNVDAAAANYEKVSAQNPKHVPSRVLLATLRTQQGRSEDALRLYREVLNISPRHALAANNLAWALAEKPGGDLDEALKYAEMAKERMPEVAEAADTLGWVHFKRGSYRVALPFIQEALSLNEKSDMKQSNPELFYHLAEVQLALGEKAAAKDAANRALALVNEKYASYRRLQQIIQQTAG